MISVKEMYFKALTGELPLNIVKKICDYDNTYKLRIDKYKDKYSFKITYKIEYNFIRYYLISYGLSSYRL